MEKDNKVIAEKEEIVFFNFHERMLEGFKTTRKKWFVAIIVGIILATIAIIIG